MAGDRVKANLAGMSRRINLDPVPRRLYLGAYVFLQIPIVSEPHSMSGTDDESSPSSRVFRGLPLRLRPGLCPRPRNRQGAGPSVRHGSPRARHLILRPGHPPSRIGHRPRGGRYAHAVPPGGRLLPGGGRRLGPRRGKPPRRHLRGTPSVPRRSDVAGQPWAAGRDPDGQPPAVRRARRGVGRHDRDHARRRPHGLRGARQRGQRTRGGHAGALPPGRGQADRPWTACWTTP